MRPRSAERKRASGFPDAFFRVRERLSALSCCSVGKRCTEKPCRSRLFHSRDTHFVVERQFGSGSRLGPTAVRCRSPPGRCRGTSRMRFLPRDPETAVPVSSGYALAGMVKRQNAMACGKVGSSGSGGAFRQVVSPVCPSIGRSVVCTFFCWVWALRVCSANCDRRRSGCGSATEGFRPLHTVLSCCSTARGGAVCHDSPAGIRRAEGWESPGGFGIESAFRGAPFPCRDSRRSA